MNPHCLICESSAVLSQDNAKAIVQLFTVLNGFAREWRPPPTLHQEPTPSGANGVVSVNHDCCCGEHRLRATRQ
jgi:hypothetical protein